MARSVAVGASAAELGFDWPDAQGPLDKVVEEADELRFALSGGSPADVREELGDLLFAACNLARKANIDPEAALHDAVSKFEHRFKLVLEEVSRRGVSPNSLELAELEAIWQSVK